MFQIQREAVERNELYLYLRHCPARGGGARQSLVRRGGGGGGGRSVADALEVGLVAVLGAAAADGVLDGAAPRHLLGLRRDQPHPRLGQDLVCMGMGLG